MILDVPVEDLAGWETGDDPRLLDASLAARGLRAAWWDVRPFGLPAGWEKPGEQLWIAVMGYPPRRHAVVAAGNWAPRVVCHDGASRTPSIRWYEPVTEVGVVCGERVPSTAIRPPP